MRVRGGGDPGSREMGLGLTASTVGGERVGSSQHLDAESVCDAEVVADFSYPKGPRTQIMVL